MQAVSDMSVSTANASKCPQVSHSTLAYVWPTLLLLELFIYARMHR